MQNSTYFSTSFYINGLFSYHGVTFTSLFAGETFVTRKVTRGVAKIHLDLMDSVGQVHFFV